MGQVTIIVGAQWGDEGKGKWVDILAPDADIVARYQGGNNAGHTLYINGEKIVLHQIPSGIFQPGKKCVLTAGVVVNPVQLVSEIRNIEPRTKVTPERLCLSPRSHVITPWHIHLDASRESASGGKIGTTKRGIGPTYESKASRIGLRLGHFIDAESRAAWFAQMDSTPGFATHRRDIPQEWQLFEDSATLLKPFVADGEGLIRKALKGGAKALFEGAQGTLLDLDHGTYPFVTSSSTAAAGALASVGFSPSLVRSIYGISKAYTTRVGGGPFPTELHDSAGEFLRAEGKEFGATTGRPRRCGWLDVVALRYACQLNGFTGVVLNKLDVLSKMGSLRLAVAYEHPKLGTLTEFPWDPEVLEDCRPVYRDFPGWQCEIPKTGNFTRLPKAARHYVDAVEELIETPITMVGTGAERGDGLFR